MSVWTVQNFQSWYYEAQQPRERGLEVVSSPGLEGREEFIKRWLKQTKQLSQLIARSWFNDEKAKEIRDIFLHPGELNDADRHLKELFAGRKNGQDGQPLSSEIFDEQELKVYRFEVNWNSFFGSVIEEPMLSLNENPFYFTIILPYPPRPAIGEFTFEYSQLEEWANSPIEEEDGLVKDPFPPYPYIPYSSS